MLHFIAMKRREQVRVHREREGGTKTCVRRPTRSPPVTDAAETQQHSAQQMASAIALILMCPWAAFGAAAFGAMEDDGMRRVRVGRVTNGSIHKLSQYLEISGCFQI